MRVTIRLGGSLAGVGGKEQVLLFTAGATIGSLLESLHIGHQGGHRGIRRSRPGTLHHPPERPEH